jgi:hypothetical protein
MDVRNSLGGISNGVKGDQPTDFTLTFILSPQGRGNSLGDRKGRPYAATNVGAQFIEPDDNGFR